MTLGGSCRGAGEHVVLSMGKIWVPSGDMGPFLASSPDATSKLLRLKPPPPPSSRHRLSVVGAVWNARAAHLLGKSSSAYSNFKDVGANDAGGRPSVALGLYGQKDAGVRAAKMEAQDDASCRQLSAGQGADA
jgi:hypothetical protein